MATEANGQAPQTIQEGKAKIIVPEAASTAAGKKEQGEVQQVFYNPIQQFNRDLSVLAIKTYGEEIVEKRRAQQANKRSKKRKRAKTDDASKDDGAHPQVDERQPAPEPETAPETGEPASTVAPDFKILDALSASGLRALRYAHEIPFVTEVTANDLSSSAAKSIEANIAYNGLQDKIKVTNDDALALMYRSIADSLSLAARKHPGRASPDSIRWDVVDLDPYGTAAPFFDAAVQSVRSDGGLLCVTCTDSAVWAGHSYPEKTYSLYGGTPVKAPYSHEYGLRLILNSIATAAGRYGLSIEPQLSLSIDFYTKVFVKVTKSPSAVKFLGGKTMMLYTCDQGCGSFQTQYLVKNKVAENKKGSGHFYKHTLKQGPTTDEHCAHCDTKTHINGPIWGGPLHSPEFVKRLLTQLPEADKTVYGTIPRLEGMLQTALEEDLPFPEGSFPPVNPRDDAHAAVEPYPFYVDPHKIASVLCAVGPSTDMFRGALTHLGYRHTRSHCRAGSVKTDAPWSTIWWVILEWIRQKAPITPKNVRPRTAGFRILEKAGILKLNEAGEVVAAGPGALVKDGDDVQMEDSKLVEAATSGQDDAAVASVANNKTDVEQEGASAAEDKEDKAAAAFKEVELRKTLLFNEDLAALGRRNQGQKKLVRYQTNPRENWGPMVKAKRQ
ncbi:uncharacterized protein J7T54_006948 [Emericellopsis cladophorae]|uniref:tRNA (guanine(26)-N(2))-dimethyltransferase n=1 Tax=Emericellopsis cladophorae TaxID=2686198 RepID=A0A9P9Y893_9HYPO|nr:uncharacterized protein J7T54_006948 [Emericellopsis cladophorae]KAI6785306.1 hypothetical protein J7T54_006948 [Emericellopsis cladophorae]